MTATTQSTARLTLQIAHRVYTIKDCDKVLVMSQGRVVEYDTPAKLLADEVS